MNAKRTLDGLVHPRVQLFSESWSAYQIWGCAGLILAILQSLVLAARSHLYLPMVLAIVICAVLTFVAVIMVTKVIVGKELIIYLHHEIAVMLVTAILLWWLRQPVLAYLDVTILGIGTFLVCGRLGCLMVGCCHGRPHRWGINYRQVHAEAGFPPHLVGVRLFPIQIVESVYVFCIVVAGTVIFSRSSPGEAIAWYVITYDIGRFCIEFRRGDTARPYFYGFSEAQWISLFLILAALGGELSGLLVFHPWHAVAAVVLVISMLVITLGRWFQRGSHQLFHARHILELARAIDQASDLSSSRLGHETPGVVCTSLGVQITAGRIDSGGMSIYHYGFSYQMRLIDDRTARSIAGLVSQLKHPSSRSEIVRRNGGTLHLLVYPIASAQTLHSTSLDDTDKNSAMEVRVIAAVSAS